MRIEIKNISGAIIYSGEFESVRHAIEQAVVDKADLYRADLCRANLYGADLREANLYGANLYGADLRGADLYGANLYGANLYGANLCGANLYWANLDSKYCYLSISPIGSVKGQLWTMRDERGVLKINRGCFSGTLPEFVEAVKNKHSGNKYEKQYMTAIEFIKTVLMVDDNGDNLSDEPKE